MGPNELGWLEQAVAALDGTGLDGGERMDAVVVILGHVRTIAQQSQAPPGLPQDHHEQQFGTVIAELLATHGDRDPAVATALASASRPSSPDRALEFGLERVFDGLGVLIAQRSGPTSTAGSNEDLSAALHGCSSRLRRRPIKVMSDPCGSTMPPDGRDRPAGSWVVVLIVRVGPTRVVSR